MIEFKKIKTHITQVIDDQLDKISYFTWVLILYSFVSLYFSSQLGLTEQDHYRPGSLHF